MKPIRVDLGEKSYPIHIGRGGEVFRPLRKLLERNSVILVSRARAGLCLKPLRPVIGGKVRILMIPDRERDKNTRTVELVWRLLASLPADRKTILVVVGGGVVGDLGGFVAATYLRGLRYIQIPTTLTAQVDSSIGGKVGVDLPQGKNLVGSFCQPLAVFSNISYLKTLSLRDLNSGLAEVLKYGVIDDPSLVADLLRERVKILRREASTLERIVARSAGIKAKIVSSDEKESGLRRILNFGHTFGHALERLTRYSRYRHGEAIAIGMALASEVSVKLGLCRPTLATQIKEALTSLGLPTVSPSFPRRDWLRAIAVDKKREEEMINFVVVREWGKVMIQPIEPRRLVALL